MPLLKGTSKSIRQQNIRELRKSGYPEKQAVAIAFSQSSKAKDKPAKVADKVANFKKPMVKK